MKRIYISPSSQEENLYAAGGTNEAEQSRKIALELVKELKRCGFDARTNVSRGKTMYDRVAESNVWKADAHIPIHSNAFDGKVTGFRGFGYDTTGEGYRLAGAIMETLAPVMPGTSDGLSAQPQLYEVKASDAPCAYLEIGFHDNPVEAQFIIDHTKEIAQAICRGICNHFGQEYGVEEQDMFEDVDPNAYYAEAVAWAAEAGIVKGVDETHFAPDRPCTRAEVVTMLYRMAQM